MRNLVMGTLITIILVGGALIVERNIRMNRPAPTAAVNQGDAGKKLPAEVQIKKLDSKDAVKFEKYAGKVLLINFWATWCQACMDEMPSIQKLYEQFKDQGLEVLAINVDESPEKVVPQVVSKLKLTFPIFTDPDGELSRAFDVVAIPFSVVADRKQNIVWAESGERDWASEGVVGEVRKLLKKE